MTATETSAPAAAPRSLAEDLRARDDDALVALLRARPDLMTPVPLDLAQLAGRSTTRASVVRALDRLDRFTLDVVDALAVLPEPATAAAVRALLGVRAAELGPALDHLRMIAVVYGGDPVLRLVRTVRDVIGQHPAGLGPPATRAARALPPARLARLVTGMGARPTGDPSADADTVADVLSDTERVAALLDQVGPEARAALTDLAGGPPVGRLRDALRTVDVENARSPVDQLLARGLLLPTGDTTVQLPLEVGLYLRGGHLHDHIRAQPPVPPSVQRDPALVDRTAGAGGQELVRQVDVLLQAWTTAPPPVLRAGGLGVRDLRRLPALLDADEPTAALVADLAYAAGLVAPSADVDEVWLPTPASDAWCRRETAGRWLLLVTTWLGTSRTPGLVGERDERNRPLAPLGSGLDRPLAPEVRRLVLDVLADLPLGSAPTPDGVLDTVTWRRPRRGGRLRDALVDWTLREAEALGITGLGALSTAGRRLAGADPDGAAEALEAVLPEPLDHILLQADLTAVAPGPLRADLAHELAVLADAESRGGASVHRFTAGSVRRALDAGRTAAEVHAFLASVSRTPVPQPLTYLIDDVARRYGLLRVGATGAYVRCDDDATLVAVLAHPRAPALGLRRIAPTVLIARASAETVLDSLRQMGFAPAGESADGSALVTTVAPRRAPARSRPDPLRLEPPVPGDALLAAAVRAVRAGDRFAESRPDDAMPGGMPRSVSAESMAALRSAAEDGRTVWIGYVDHDGWTSERVVDPVRLEGGWLTAFDHRSSEVRSFALHRISGVAAAR